MKYLLRVCFSLYNCLLYQVEDVNICGKGFAIVIIVSLLDNEEGDKCDDFPFITPQVHTSEIEIFQNKILVYRRPKSPVHDKDEERTTLPCMHNTHACARIHVHEVGE